MPIYLVKKKIPRWACQVNERLKRAFHTKNFGTVTFIFPLIIKVNQMTVHKHWLSLRAFFA